MISVLTVPIEPWWVSASTTLPSAPQRQLRGSAAPESAPATTVRSQDVVPSASIGASAQLRPWLPLASAGRRFTGPLSGSSTLVNDGM